MRIDCQIQALHFFICVVRDHTNVAKPTDNPSLPEDHSSNHSRPGNASKEYVMLIACTLTKHMPFFKKFGSGIEHHLIHKQYEEMSAKSEVVSIYITTEMARTEAIDLLIYCKTKDASNYCQAKGHPI